MDPAGARTPYVAVIVAAIAIGTVSGVAPVIMVCPAIYLFAAVVGRRVGGMARVRTVVRRSDARHRADHPWISLAALGAIQLVLVIVGLFRGTWRVPVSRLQVLGAVVFSAIAVAAATGGGLWPGLIAIVGLLGHAGWDLWHHRTDVVVMRSYAAFCAALDIVLAAVVAVALIAGD